MDSHIAKVTERDGWEMPELVEELVLLLSSVDWLKSTISPLKSFSVVAYGKGDQEVLSLHKGRRQGLLHGKRLGQDEAACCHLGSCCWGSTFRQHET